MRLVNEIVSPSGKCIVLLYQRDDGHYWFEEIYEDFDEYAGVLWAQGFQSGLFADEELAQAEVRAVTPWLKNAQP